MSGPPAGLIAAGRSASPRDVRPAWRGAGGSRAGTDLSAPTCMPWRTHPAAPPGNRAPGTPPPRSTALPPCPYSSASGGSLLLHTKTVSPTAEMEAAQIVQPRGLTVLRTVQLARLQKPFYGCAHGPVCRTGRGEAAASDQVSGWVERQYRRDSARDCRQADEDRPSSAPRPEPGLFRFLATYRACF